MIQPLKNAWLVDEQESLLKQQDIWHLGHNSEADPGLLLITPSSIHLAVAQPSMTTPEFSIKEYFLALRLPGMEQATSILSLFYPPEQSSHFQAATAFSPRPWVSPCSCSGVVEEWATWPKRMLAIQWDKKKPQQNRTKKPKKPQFSAPSDIPWHILIYCCRRSQRETGHGLTAVLFIKGEQMITGVKCIANIKVHIMHYKHLQTRFFRQF